MACAGEGPAMGTGARGMAGRLGGRCTAACTFRETGQQLAREERAHVLAAGAVEFTC